MRHFLSIVILPISSLVNAATDSFEFDSTIVISPTKLSQSLHDTPASVTVITQDQIRNLGIQSVAEVLRLVPGMAVGVTTMNNYQLAYLAPSVRATRRMNVLIDGMSIYHADMSRVEWPNIPVHINDIERIEVTRSPSSAVYGANSFEAVINIITKNPVTQQGVQAEGYYGSIDTLEGYLGYGGSLANDTTYHLTFSSRQNDGYDERENHLPRRDETDLDSFNFKGVTETRNGNIDYALSGVQGVLTLENSDPRRISPSDQYVTDLSTNINYFVDLSQNNALKIHLDYSHNKHNEEWTTCYYAILFTDEMRAMYLANPAYAQALLAGQMPSGGTPADDALALAVLSRAAGMTNPTYLTNVCGKINENSVEKKGTLSIEDTHIFNDSLRGIWTAGLMYNEVDSQTYFGDSFDSTLGFTSLNIEYKFYDFVLNAGVMAEQADIDYRKDWYLSPRLALNYHVTQTDTLRFIVSKAYRTPDSFEQYANWNYTMTNMTPPLDGVTTEALFYFSSQSAGNLVPEEIISKEVSYYGAFPNINATLDVKYFNHTLSNLISDKGYFFDFNLDNNSSAKRKGAELELHLQTLPALNNSLGYSYLDCEANHPFEDQPLCARHSGFATATYDVTDNYNTSLAYYASDNVSGLPFHRIDWVLRYLSHNTSHNIDASFIVRHYTSDGGYTYDQTTVITNKFLNNTQYFVELSLRY